MPKMEKDLKEQLKNSKQLKTELPVNNFQQLHVFEAEKLNEYCDSLVSRIKEITGENAYLVGSVSKLLSEDLPEDYLIKDIDFIVSFSAFRKLIQHKNTLLSAAKTTELRPERIIIYLNNIVIEIWNFMEKNIDKEPKLYKNKIHYLCQLEQK